MEKDNEKPIKVVVTGPESTGKSTLCSALAKYYKTDYVPEYAREYLIENGREYIKEDLIKITEGQIKLEEQYQKQISNLLVCDTSLEVIRVWSEWKYNSCDPFILEQANARTPDLFLLMTPDLPWQPDPLRENPDDRQEIFAYYKKVLTEYHVKVVEVYGDEKSRKEIAINSLNDLFPTLSQ
ncbi:MAG: ATPase [Bacteroidetes bacterium]|nr:MAG: ATPase [Bacteroidota bacterium]